MVDALAPAVRAYQQALAAGASLSEAAQAAAGAAELGAEATIPLQALKGRASYLGARSVGHQDPGATSTALILAALARVLEGQGS
jgi:dihydroxyacetone kinase-like protein